MKFVFHLVFILVCFSQIGVANGQLEGLLGALGPIVGGLLKLVLGLLGSLLGGLGGNGGNGGTCGPDVDLGGPLINLEHMFVSAIDECLAGNDHKDKVVAFITMSLVGTKLADKPISDTDKKATLAKLTEQIQKSVESVFKDENTDFGKDFIEAVTCINNNYDYEDFTDILVGNIGVDYFSDCLVELDNDVIEIFRTIEHCLPAKAEPILELAKKLKIVKY